MKLKKMGHKFMKGLKKNWRIVTRKRTLFRKRSSNSARMGRSFINRSKSTLMKSTLLSNKEKQHQGYNSIAELRKEIDHWYAPQQSQITSNTPRVLSGAIPPVPPPHRIVTPLVELPMDSRDDVGSLKARKIRSLRCSLSSKASALRMRELSTGTVKHMKMDSSPEYELHDVLRVYLMKILSYRIQAKLNIAHVEDIPQTRQSSFVRNEILNSYYQPEKGYQGQTHTREASNREDFLDLEESDSEESEVMSEMSESVVSISRDNYSSHSMSVSGTETYSESGSDSWTDARGSIMDSECFSVGHWHSKGWRRAIPRSPASIFNRGDSIRMATNST